MVTIAKRARLGSAVLALFLLAGCGGSGTVDTTIVTATRTFTRPVPSPAPTSALDTGPVTATTASACPRIAQQSVSDAVGMRLARITVLRSGGSIVGCRFYALQGSPLATSERLPGPNQPAVEFVATQYLSPLSAHNALVRAAEKGSGAMQVEVAAGNTGVAFQTTFDPADGAKDWACGFTVGARVVVVRTDVDDQSDDAVALCKDLEPTYTG